MLIRSLPLSFLLLVHNSFKNLAYLGICFIASNRGMFTYTFLNVSKISFSASSIFLLEIALGGNGRGICCFCKSELPVEDSPAQKLLGKFLSLPFYGVEWSLAGSFADEEDAIGWDPWHCFPDLNEMALTFLGFWTAWEGILSEFYDWAW